MIVSEDGDRQLLVTQPDHAHFAAELLSLWRSGGLPAHPRRAELLFAVREHDNGWRETDSAPHCNRETGRPHDFLSLPREDRIELWRRGVSRYAGERPYAALLIVRHALNLHESRRGQEGWEAFLDHLGELREELLATPDTTDMPEEELEADYRWLDLADLLSLTACSRRPAAVERHGFRALVESGEKSGIILRLDPFPLAGATAFRVPCRRIPARRCRGDADLGGELAAARWEELAVRVAPFSSAP